MSMVPDLVSPSSSFSGQSSSGLSSNYQFLLVTHGSSDPRHGIAAQLLGQRLRDWFIFHNFHNYLVENVVLEGHESSLAAQVMDQLNATRSAGIERSVLVPLFLLPGMHVMEDIPAEIAVVKAQLAIGSESVAKSADDLAYPRLSVMPFLGNWSPLKAALLDDLVAEPGEDSGDSSEGDVMLGRITHRILLAHGSRWPGAMDSLEAIAQTLRMTTAYWLIEPKLEQRIEELIAGGGNVIEIVPYFLFEGGISDAIDRLMQSVFQRFPQVEFVMQDVLAVRPDFVEMLGQELVRFVSDESQETF
jgi:sirohydrochlorin cobaltochelatase